MPEIYGTNHFGSRRCAQEYYRSLYDCAELAVHEKIKAGEIAIGPPEERAGFRCVFNASEGRYFMEKEGPNAK